MMYIELASMCTEIVLKLISSQIFLATKFANVVNPDGTRAIKNEPEYVKEACVKSMKRLGIPTIDLYYCHRLSGKVPIETMMKAMAELVKSGSQELPYPCPC